MKRHHFPISSGIFLLFLFLFFAANAAADLCCYILPVKLTFASGKKLAGFLSLYGDEIHGLEASSAGCDGGKEEIVSNIIFGGNRPSTQKEKWTNGGYDFKSIEYSRPVLTVNLADGSSVKLKCVSYFFSACGLKFYPKIKFKNGQLDPLENIPMLINLGQFKSLNVTGAAENHGTEGDED